MESSIKQTIIEIIEHLRAKNRTITFAESCTGGRIAAAFTAIPGVSSILNGSCVTYSNEIKSKWLGVSKETLAKHGAVSKECVEEMLEGILSMSNADYAIAVSGIAGPTGGTEKKPVGTVYIGVESKEGITTVQHYLFQGDRKTIQDQATKTAITLLKKNL